MKVFDSHCHLDDPQFDPDRGDAYGRMLAADVKKCVCVGSDIPTSLRCLDFANSHPGVYAAVGVHPHEAKDAPADMEERLVSLMAREEAVALGEIGLDYHYDFSPRDVQMDVMARQFQLALEKDWPVIYHIREAHGDMLAFFRAQKRLPSGVIHCFSGSAETAKEYVKMGFYISFAGPLTFKKAPNLWEAARAVPLNRLLVETDSPYLAPEPYRGKRNEPAFAVKTLEKLAELREMSAAEMAEITWRNAHTFYRLG